MEYIYFEITAATANWFECNHIAQNALANLRAENPDALEIIVSVMHDGYNVASANFFV